MKTFLILFFAILFFACNRQKIKRKGCTGKSTVITETYNSDSVTFFVPNAFTPNGDGINDRFDLFGTGYSSYEITIYKRNKIIYNNSYNGWDGSTGPTKAKNGIYKYKFSVTTTHNEIVEIEGEVSLISIIGSEDYTPIKNCSSCLFGDMIDPKLGFVFTTQDAIGCE